MNHLRNVFSITALLAISPLQAEVSLPPIFSDHMVLQRNQPVRVWGKADPGEVVTVGFKDQVLQATTGDDARWEVILDPMEASYDPAQLTVSGINRIELADILVGEVWLCSGQSNMEKPMGEQHGQLPTENYEQEIARAGYPGIRLFQYPHYGKVSSPDWQLKWLRCSPESLASSRFSAVGYYFARKVHLEADVPVGIIHSSFGGTMIEAWMPSSAFHRDPLLEPLLYRKYFSWVDGVQATDLYQSMIEPMVPFTLHGFLWYQGEANLMYSESTIYARKMKALIQAWRDAFQQPGAPFLYVQLAPFNYSEWDKFPKRQTPEALPLFWEVQTSVLAYPDTGMVVTTDLAGDARDIHPVRKLEVGDRLASLALDYLPETEKEAPHPRSPMLEKVTIRDRHIILKFDTVDGDLKTRDGEKPDSFEIAGPDRVFHPASAVVRKDRVQLTSPQIEHPVAVRFGWDETANPNLVSATGLPVTPFRTDNWPIQNEKATP